MQSSPDQIVERCERRGDRLELDKGHVQLRGAASKMGCLVVGLTYTRGLRFAAEEPEAFTSSCTNREGLLGEFVRWHRARLDDANAGVTDRSLARISGRPGSPQQLFIKDHGFY